MAEVSLRFVPAHQPHDVGSEHNRGEVQGGVQSQGVDENEVFAERETTFYGYARLIE